MGRGVAANKEGDAKGSNRSSQPSVFSAIRSVFAYAEPADRWLMSLGFLGAVGDGFSMPVLLTIMGKTLNNIGAGPSSTNFMHSVNQNSLHLVYLAIGCLVVSFFEGYCWTRTGERQASTMRARYLKAVLRQDVGFFDLKFASTNEVITSVSTDSLVIQDMISEKAPNFIMNFSTFFGSYVAGFILLWRLAAVALPAAALLLIPGLIYGRVLLGLSRKIQIEYDKAGAVAEQAFSRIRTVYSSTAEGRTIAGFSAAVESSVLLGRKQGLAKGAAFGSNGVTFSIWAFMLWYSGRLVMYRGAEGGTVFAVCACIVIGGLALGASFSNLKYFAEAMAAAERIARVVRRRPPIDSESGDGEEMGRVEGEVEFKEVRFGYPGRGETEVLRGFNLRVEGGKTVALVGGSGSGKSTAVALLQRFYDVAGGEIAVDGVDVRRLRLKWLRGKMGMVSQEPALFATTIRENILFGKEVASMEEVVAAAVTANAHGFISQLPMGYETQVGERGVQMSGGQKQRIAIARAVVRSPAILLLDEATNALDFKSERIVQEALDAATVGRTTIVIAHRLSAIRNAHSIAFLHAGRVAEFGSHDQLLLAHPNGHYAALFRAQQSQPPLHDPHAADVSTLPSRRVTAPSPAHSPVDEKTGAEGGRGKPPVPSLRRLLMMNAPEWKRAAVGCGSAALFGGVQPAYSYALGSVIMVFFIQDHDEMKEKTRTYALLFVGLTFFSFVVNVLQHYNLGVMGECLTRRVRERMISKMLTFEVGWFDREENSTGALCSRLAKDATLVRSLVGDRMSLLIQTLSAVTVACVMGLVIAWRLALIMIATQPITILCFYAQRVLLTAMSTQSITAQSESSKLAAEAVGNHRTITAFSSQHRILHLFHLAQSGPLRRSTTHSLLAGAGLGLSKSLTTCIWSLGFYYGGHLVHQHLISGKALFQTFMIIASTGRVIADAGSVTADLSKGSQSVASVFSILDRITPINPSDPAGHRPESIAGEISLLSVDFAYPTRPDTPVLKNLSIFIPAGKSTALVGSSGSGKSTIISLIERFYDPLRGAVSIDGRDLRSYHLRSLRRHIALVPQEPALFAGTVRDNIAYGAGDVSDAEVEAAAMAANAHQFICGMKGGYGGWCGELSGGQKQRVAIARAVLRNPAILLLDEATSALDGWSEAAVQAALEKLMVGKTTVMVAHRMDTIRNCDVIAVLHNGVLVEKGNHGELMGVGPGGAYYGLVSMQQGPQHKVA